MTITETKRTIVETTEKIVGMVERVKRFDPLGEYRVRPPEFTLIAALDAFCTFDRLIKFTGDLETESRRLIDQLSPSIDAPNRYRSKYSGWGTSADNIQRIAPGFRYTLPSVDELSNVDELLESASAAIQSADEQFHGGWKPALRELFSDNELYKQWKTEKRLPFGARDAFSVLRVWASGVMSNNYTDQDHEIFGQQFRLDTDQLRNIQRVKRKLRVSLNRGGIFEKRGRAPSWAAGVRVLRQYRRPRWDATPARDNVTGRAAAAIHSRVARLNQTVPSMFGDDGAQYSHPMLYRALVEPETARQHRVNKRWIRGRISAEIRCTPGAVLIGEPKQISPTDYAITALWRTNGVQLGTTRGLLLFRAGLPSCYHLADGNLDDTGAVRLDGRTEPLADFANRVLTSRAESYFRYRYGCDKQTYEQRRAAERQRVASIARKLRYLARIDATLTPADSYAVSNCRPGTAEFMEKLNIDTNRITARDILRRWRDANYIERELFGRVVDRLYESSGELQTTQA